MLVPPSPISDIGQIATHLTAQGLPTKRQTLIKFYRRAVKKALEIKKELADLEQMLNESSKIK